MRFSGFLLAASFTVVGFAAHADVKIGLLLPKTGFGASYGAQEQAAIDMFLEKYPDIGPAGKMALVTYDTRGAPTDAISLTRKLIDSDEVAGIVGPYFSGESETAFPVAARGETPIVTPTSAKPGITKAGLPWAFRFASTTARIDDAVLGYWLKHAGKPIKRVVVLYDSKDAVSSSDGKAVFPGEIKARGLEILDSITFQTGDMDFSGQVTRAKALNPDGIVLAAIASEAGHVVAELRKQGMTQPIVAGVELLDPHFLTIAGEAAEGVTTATDFYYDNPKPAVVAFTKEFQQRFKEQPTQSAGMMYDTLFTMRHCLMETGIKDSSAASRAKLRDCWRGLKNFDAPLGGAVNFNDENDNIRSPVILVVTKGQFVAQQQ